VPPTADSGVRTVLWYHGLPPPITSHTLKPVSSFMCRKLERSDCYVYTSTFTEWFRFRVLASLPDSARKSVENALHTSPATFVLATHATAQDP